MSTVPRRTVVDAVCKSWAAERECSDACLDSPQWTARSASLYRDAKKDVPARGATCATG